MKVMRKYPRLPFWPLVKLFGWQGFQLWLADRKLAKIIDRQNMSRSETKIIINVEGI